MSELPYFEEFRVLHQEYMQCLDQCEALLNAGYYDAHPDEWEKVSQYILATKKDIDGIIEAYGRYVKEL